jgi:hypothetical protein
MPKSPLLFLALLIWSNKWWRASFFQFHFWSHIFLAPDHPNILTIIFTHPNPNSPRPIQTMANSSTMMKMIMTMMAMVVTMMQWSLQVEGQIVEPFMNITELPADTQVMTMTTNVDQIGIRIVYNEGQASTVANEYCTAADLAMMQSTAWNKVYIGLGRRHRVRRGRSLAATSLPPQQRQLMPGYCTNVCQGFATGTCQGVHSACDDWRRELGVSTSFHDTMETSAVDPNNTDHGSLDPDQERKLSSLVTAQERCQYEINQVRAALQSDLYTQISSTCQNLMTKPITLQCVLFRE